MRFISDGTRGSEAPFSRYIQTFPFLLYSIVLISTLLGIVVRLPVTYMCWRRVGPIRGGSLWPSDAAYNGAFFAKDVW